MVDPSGVCVVSVVCGGCQWCVCAVKCGVCAVKCGVCAVECGVVDVWCVLCVWWMCCVHGGCVVCVVDAK